MRQFEKFQVSDLDSYFEEAYARGSQGHGARSLRDPEVMVGLLMNEWNDKWGYPL